VGAGFGATTGGAAFGATGEAVGASDGGAAFVGAAGEAWGARVGDAVFGGAAGAKEGDTASGGAGGACGATGGAAAFGATGDDAAFGATGDDAAFGATDAEASSVCEEDAGLTAKADEFPAGAPCGFGGGGRCGKGLAGVGAGAAVTGAGCAVKVAGKATFSDRAKAACGAAKPSAAKPRMHKDDKRIVQTSVKPTQKNGW
jgi:hypothetical protein